MRFVGYIAFILLSILVLANACKKPIEEPMDTDSPYELIIPPGFPKMPVPASNPTTVKGVALGRRLFYDPILSATNTISCASCHHQNKAFADSALFSKGVNGAVGTINALSLVNIGWYQHFFWNGRAKSLEEQALEPIQNPIEMHETLPNVVAKLQKHGVYPDLFKKAFGTATISADLIAKALAQFERTMISGGTTKFDAFLASSNPGVFTKDEYQGYLLFFSETTECFHCHGGALTTTTKFENNGLEENIDNTGYGAVVHKPDSDGMFKVPALRNAEFTAPYMHDGRFKTLEQVIEHYNSGMKDSRTLFPKLKIKYEEGGLNLTEKQKQQLLAFLKTFTDTTFQHRKDLANPF